MNLTEKSIDEEIREAIEMASAPKRCLVEDYHLVKIILPKRVHKELKKRVCKVVKDPFCTLDRFVSVPCEVRDVKNIQYVIEGRLTQL